MYVKAFQLFGVNIDNKLLRLEDNFIEIKKKIKQKIAIWRKLNLLKIGNLIISKTFLINITSRTPSMINCPQELIADIQNPRPQTPSY